MRVVVDVVVDDDDVGYGSRECSQYCGYCGSSNRQNKIQSVNPRAHSRWLAPVFVLLSALPLSMAPGALSPVSTFDRALVSRSLPGRGDHEAGTSRGDSSVMRGTPVQAQAGFFFQTVPCTWLRTSAWQRYRHEADKQSDGVCTRRDVTSGDEAHEMHDMVHACVVVGATRVVGACAVAHARGWADLPHPKRTAPAWPRNRTTSTRSNDHVCRGAARQKKCSSIGLVPNAWVSSCGSVVR